MHQKMIVHRDLKLESLLLDRHGNLIITDFGFANRFGHEADELMKTSCGSPFCAAPELVTSGGKYVGSAVDIWSCGVILYAMLTGYLPFDDDPANPDGDNIDLLYKYIVNTPLSFPVYTPTKARDLLSLILVPDPKTRANIQTVTSHLWLHPYAALFDTLEDLEHAAMEQQRQKRTACQREMTSIAAAKDQQMAKRQSAPTDGCPNSVKALPSPTTSSRLLRGYNKSHQQQQVPRISQSENDTTQKEPVPSTTFLTPAPTSTSNTQEITALPPTPQTETPRPRATPCKSSLGAVIALAKHYEVQPSNITSARDL